MATLILTTIGTAIGGPIGGAVGALLGQSVDARLFAPRGRSGPRLSDLRVQTSAYGTAIPRLYGRMRVSGTVIWASDLVEHRNRSGGGKGRPSVTSYSYSASFAVALSSRPVAQVGRIWAEGNILRGQDGGFKSATGFRVHHGSAGQAVDPLIASAEGLADCPAYRDLAYVVFEDMDLSPFGNRIPSLSFEVLADGDPPTLGGVMADLLGAATDRIDIAEQGPMIGGIAITDDDRRAALTRLDRIVPVRRLPSGPHRWRIGDPMEGAAVALPESVIGPRGQRGSRSHYGAAGQRPSHVVVDHYDRARDYQLSRQSARVAGGTGPVDDISLPLSLSASSAKALAVTLATRAAQGAERREHAAGLSALAIPSGAVVGDNGGRHWRVGARRISATQVVLDLDPPAPVAAVMVDGADGGRGLLSPDLPVGATQAFIFDMPRWDGGVAGVAAGPLVIAAGSGAGWRGAEVAVRASVDGPLAALGSVRPTGIVGSVVAVASVPQAGLFDRDGHIDVLLLRPDMTLSNLNEADLLAGGNMAVAGGELFQFARADPMGSSIWRLTGLLRGRLGTDDAMDNLAPGAGFALITADAALPLPSHVALAPLTQTAQAEIAAVGDPAPLVLPIPHPPRSEQPLQPAHLTATWQDDGGVALRWVRRSRLGFGWVDGTDAPLETASELYRIAVQCGAASHGYESAAPFLLVGAADTALWAATSAAATIAITQVDAAMQSRPATLSLPLNFS